MVGIKFVVDEQSGGGKFPMDMNITIECKPLLNGFPEFELSEDNLHYLILMFKSAIKSCSSHFSNQSKYHEYYLEQAGKYIENGLDDNPMDVADRDSYAVEKCKFHAKENMPELFEEIK